MQKGVGRLGLEKTTKLSCAMKLEKLKLKLQLVKGDGNNISW
jgi:hypothetical protein